jgi:hypothetical protein
MLYDEPDIVKVMLYDEPDIVKVIKMRILR